MKPCSNIITFAMLATITGGNRPGAHRLSAG